MWKEAWSIVYPDKIKSLRQEMGLVDFQMYSTKKLEVHCNIHMDGQCHKMVTLENVEVCCKEWYIVLIGSKANFYRFQYYSSQGQCSCSIRDSTHRNLKRLHVKLLQYYQSLFFPLLM